MGSRGVLRFLRREEEEHGFLPSSQSWSVNISSSSSLISVLSFKFLWRLTTQRDRVEKCTIKIYWSQSRSVKTDQKCQKSRLCATSCHTEKFIHAPTKKRLVVQCHQNLKSRVSPKPQNETPLVVSSGEQSSSHRVILWSKDFERIMKS